jgi:hypothetical protein
VQPKLATIPKETWYCEATFDFLERQLPAHPAPEAPTATPAAAADNEIENEDEEPLSTRKVTKKRHSSRKMTLYTNVVLSIPCIHFILCMFYIHSIFCIFIILYLLFILCRFSI